MLKKLIHKINLFDDIYKLVSKFTNKQKGDLFEEFTKYIFKFHVNYINDTKKVWLLNELPDNLKKKLNIPSKDMGIDLVVLTNDDKYYAVQCKFRSNVNEEVAWSNLSTFVGLAFGIGKNFSKAFYVTNTFSINELIKSNPAKLISIYGDFFTDLPSSFLLLVKNYIFKDKIENIIVKTPLKHQIEIINKSICHYAINDRGYIEVACGGGKTLISYWINKQMMNKLTIVAVPSLYLLSQFFNEWANQMILEKEKMDFILIGSDVDTGECEYVNNGLLVKLDVEDIKEKILKIIDDNKIKDMEMHNLVIMTTYQSSDKLIDALDDLEITPDMCFFDEAHKTVGQKDKQFTLLLNDDNIKINKRFFMTATQKIYGGDDENEEILSMDDEEWYGKLIYCYNTQQAINDKNLVDYQIVTMYTDNKYINNIISKNKYVLTEELKRDDSYYLACAIMLLNAIRDGECHHLVTYHNRNKKSKKFKDILESLLPYYEFDEEIELLQLDGDMSMNKRNKIIRDFNNAKISILTSARVLNEGINIPIIDGECFIDPRTSTIDIIQCIGRALRKHEKKKNAKIFVPIMIDDINNIDENKTFGNMIRIIKSLSTTDEGIREYFIAKKNGSEYNRKIIKHINYLSVEKIGETININEWMSSIEMKIWMKSDSWEYIYECLKQWVEENNKIPSNMSKNNIEKNLGIWSCRQRQNKKNNKLEKDKIDKLNKIKEWYWKIDDPFDDNYSELVKWVEENKKIPSDHSKNNIEKKLWGWAANQKQNKKKNKLDKDKIDKLDKIKGWRWTDESRAIIKSFDDNYSELVKWIEENKKIPSQSSENNIEKKLGNWTTTQKHNKKNNKLDKDKIDKLDKIKGWRWTDESRAIIKSFDDNYNELVKWIEENKKIPSQYSENNIEKRLGNWATTQKQNKKNNKLDKDKIDKLDKIKGWRWIDESFDDNYSELVKWIEENKKMPSQSSENNIEKKRGRWAATQKQNKKNNKLDKDKIDKLDKIKRWYWSKNDKNNLINTEESISDDEFIEIKPKICKKKIQIIFLTNRY